MYRISELAEIVGLSRTTLLYYEKLGLLKGRRQSNGYRIYSDADRQRLQFMKHLQAGGLSLQECRACLDGKVDRQMLSKRLQILEREIASKTRSRDLLSALLGRSSLKEWHEEVERIAPDLHRSWLIAQGFTGEEAGHVAWLSKDMNDHDDYMAVFMQVFSELDWWGPGSDETTRRALSMVPFDPQTILEIGCGNGMATRVLAENTAAQITATDTAGDALDRLRAWLEQADLTDRVSVERADMADLPTPDQPWDLIWSEGSAYIMGVDRAFAAWRHLLRPGGVLVLSDMVWRTTNPDPPTQAFWDKEYPGMSTVSARIAQAERAGYDMLGHFDLGQAAMDTYYVPLEARVTEMCDRFEGHRVFDDLTEELRIWREGNGAFGFEMFILQLPDLANPETS